MNREIKFRAWDKLRKKMFLLETLELLFGMHCANTKIDGCVWLKREDTILMQYTGLKDKKNLQEVYEGDIIDTEGNIKGNIYETNKEKTDLVIQGFGTKDWLTTYKEAVERGCQDA